MDFLKELNEAQYNAVTNYEGATMIVAGPGSGKTRVLTYRIAFMIQPCASELKKYAPKRTAMAAKHEIYTWVLSTLSLREFSDSKRRNWAIAPTSPSTIPTIPEVCSRKSSQTLD